MQQELNSASGVGTRPFSNAAITLVALVLTFAAFDDITTDNATTFRTEYTLLVGCAAWLLFVAWSLVRGGHRALGLVSLVALTGALWAQRAIEPHSSTVRELRPEYVVIAAAYLWFWVLAGTMLWLAWRGWKGRERQAAWLMLGQRAAGASGASHANGASPPEDEMRPLERAERSDPAQRARVERATRTERGGGAPRVSV